MRVVHQQAHLHAKAREFAIVIDSGGILALPKTSNYLKQATCQSARHVASMNCIHELFIAQLPQFTAPSDTTEQASKRFMLAALPTSCRITPPSPLHTRIRFNPLRSAAQQHYEIWCIPAVHVPPRRLTGQLSQCLACLQMPQLARRRAHNALHMQRRADTGWTDAACAPAASHSSWLPVFQIPPNSAGAAAMTARHTF